MIDSSIHRPAPGHTRGPHAAFFLLPVVALALVAAAWLSARPGPVAASPHLQGPSSTPDVRNGQALFQENCAPCHGAAGLGDGPTAAELPQGATALADPAIARAASPAAWFEVVKEGRMSLFMPPWKNRLSDEQIWDVVTYSLGLHTDEAELQTGEALWGEQCAACHGMGGAGDGAQAVAAGLAMPNLADPDVAAAQSLDAWSQITRAGQGEMPAFAADLSDEEIWASVEYARTFAFPPLRAAAVPAGAGRLSGRVTNGTTGAAGAGLAVTLNAFDNFTELQSQQVVAGPDGAFAFEGLPTGSQYVYLLTTVYGDSTFGSEIVSFPAGEETLNVPLQVYETAATPGEITINLAQWFVDSHQGALLVGELYRITHDSDRVYSGGEEVAPGKNAVLRFNLPPGATSLVLDGGEVGQRFVRTADGVVDTQPLLPGGTQILMRYLLPYSGSKAELTHSVNYPVERLNALVVDGPKVATDLTSLGPQTVSDQQWNSFEGVNLAAGEQVSLKLSGLTRAESPSASLPGASTAVVAHNSGLLFAVGAVAFVGALGVFAAYMLRRPAAPDNAEATPTTSLVSSSSQDASSSDLADERSRLLTSIARLDDQYAAGELDDAAYQTARVAQKRSLLLVTQQLAQGAPSEP